MVWKKIKGCSFSGIDPAAPPTNNPRAPRIAVKGVRNSWLTVEMNSFFMARGWLKTGALSALALLGGLASPALADKIKHPTAVFSGLDKITGRIISFEVAIDETRKTYPAKVSAINARVDAVAQTVELEARIDGKPPELLAGMSGIARFPGLQ